MNTYRYPLSAPHGAFVSFLLRTARRWGLLAATPPPANVSRRHRLMFAADERRHHVRTPPEGSGPRRPDVSARSQPTEFGPLCSAIACSDPRPVATCAGSTRDRAIERRLRIERAYLALDRQHQGRVRRMGLDDREAVAQVHGRERRIQLLMQLRLEVGSPASDRPRDAARRSL